jgi:enamine deaminase RidA (YjgF/YER057c/UK114 family)
VEKQLITRPGYTGGLDGRAWSPGIKVGPWLHLSGVVAVDYDRGVIAGVSGGSAMTPGKVDPEAQWRTCLGSIKELVEAAGGTMADVVLANIFVTDMRYYYEYEWIRQEFFVEPYPVSTAVACRDLVHPDWILEIEALAYIEGT